ncbi:hypothetical protein [Muricoccus radiodurans]|uniref:hypothetical protein n=1 Tax=Muricoccus radiodurans TaxID=2231721 RepID=UPI003CF03153
MKGCVALAAGLLLGAGAAVAQGDDSCAGRVVVNSVYATGGGGGVPFEYFAQVQNQTEQPRRYTLTFSGFPEGATVMRRVSGGPLRPYEQDTQRFGRGDQPGLQLRDVTVVTDREGGSAGPTVTLSGCGVAR